MNNVQLQPLETTVDILRDIIKKEMCLEDDHIFIYNQKWNTPNDDALYVIIEYVGSKIISSRNTNSQDNAGNYREVQDLNTQEQITILLLSRGLEALQRKEEAVMALYSIYSQQKQSELSFKIARNAPIEDLSSLEASAILYRFDIPVVLFTWYEKIKSANYYNSMHVKVRVNDGQPDMIREFDQPLIQP